MEASGVRQSDSRGRTSYQRSDELLRPIHPVFPNEQIDTCGYNPTDVSILCAARRQRGRLHTERSF